MSRPSNSGAPRKPGRPHRSLSREALLEAGRAEFARAGYEGTSMATVADRLNIRKPSLFHHVPSKEALYFTVMEETVRELATLLASVMEPVAETWEVRLDLFSAALIRYLGGHPEVASLLYRDLMFNGPYFDGPGRDPILGLVGGVVDFFDEGMRRGELLRQDARHLTISVLGMHFSFFAAAELRGELLPERGGDPVEERLREGRQQLRRLCGLAAGA